MFPPVLKATEVKVPASRVLQFQVSSVFAFGSPLGIVLANRQRQSGSTNGTYAHKTLHIYVHMQVWQATATLYICIVALFVRKTYAHTVHPHCHVHAFRSSWASSFVCLAGKTYHCSSPSRVYRVADTECFVFQFAFPGSLCVPLRVGWPAAVGACAWSGGLGEWRKSLIFSATHSISSPAPKATMYILLQLDVLHGPTCLPH